MEKKEETSVETGGEAPTVDDAGDSGLFFYTCYTKEHIGLKKKNSDTR